MSEVPLYRGYSKLRTHTTLGPHGSSIPRGIGEVRVLTSSNPCTHQQGDAEEEEHEASFEAFCSRRGSPQFEISNPEP